MKGVPPTGIGLGRTCVECQLKEAPTYRAEPLGIRAKQGDKGPTKKAVVMQTSNIVLGSPLPYLALRHGICDLPNCASR